MPFKFNHYHKIKDLYCIGYFGHNAEYLIQLKLLRPYLHEQFKGLRIYLACQNHLLPLLKDEPDIISKETLYRNRRSFGSVEEIKSKMSNEHPIQSFLNEIGMDCPEIKVTPQERTTLCVIASKSHLPVQPAPTQKINKIIDSMQSQGYNIKHNMHINELDGAGWVIGVENEILYEAASRGIKTTLIPTGLGTDLFKKMFPQAEIFDI